MKKEEVFLHIILLRSSWLNLVERFFGVLGVLTEKQLKKSAFTYVKNGDQFERHSLNA